MNKPAGKIEAAKKPSGVISIHGREYQTVAYRVAAFRERHPDFALTTAVMARDAECVVVQASIADAAGFVLATGHAEEYRKSSQINKTSALENAETSAIGRALAALGFGGTEFATASEVQNAIHQQDVGTGEEPPAKRVPLAGPYTSKTALWAAVKLLDRDIRGCGDADELICLLATAESKALIDQCKRDAPSLWNEGLPDLPEFIPLEILISDRMREFEEIENIHSNTRTVIDAG